MKAVRPRVSYADLERAPEDGCRYELYDGEVFVVPSPLPKHQVVAITVAEIIRHAPDLCVEVVSPSTASTDRGKKMQMFARYAVPEYWIVDPVAESIEIYELRDAAYELKSTATDAADAISPSAVPGLTFTAGSLFPER